MRLIALILLALVLAGCWTPAPDLSYWPYAGPPGQWGRIHCGRSPLC